MQPHANLRSFGHSLTHSHSLAPILTPTLAHKYIQTHIKYIQASITSMHHVRQGKHYHNELGQTASVLYRIQGSITVRSWSTRDLQCVEVVLGSKTQQRLAIASTIAIGKRKEGQSRWSDKLSSRDTKVRCAQKIVMSRSRQTDRHYEINAAVRQISKHRQLIVE